MKHLVVCCDGTWNTPDQAGPTNVTKIALGLAPFAGDGTPQLLYYHPGVGTRRSQRLRGGGFGLGLSRNICDCYRFLVENYDPGDRLYFLGFSRGAFTARSTIGLVRNAGILRREHVDRVGEAYELYRRRGDAQRPNGIAARIFQRMYAHDVIEIHFAGMWDTVGALGIPGLRGPLAHRRWGFHDTELSNRVRHAYQALAIDEQRSLFPPAIWQQQADAVDQTLEQRWFAGVHCDVGGGYVDSSLSELALLWLVERAKACGLAFRSPGYLEVAAVPDPDQRRVAAQVDPDPCAAIGSSYKGLYRLLGARPRDLAGPGELARLTVAPSVLERRNRVDGYAPANLERYLAASASAIAAKQASAALLAQRRRKRSTPTT